jgi:ABC-type transporter Mla MlaB component
MLRITRQPGADHDTLLLEGNLLKEWIQELQEALAGARQNGAAVALDLSGLRFVDAEGTSLLRECRRRGISLFGASPFVSALLDPPPSRRRRSRS